MNNVEHTLPLMVKVPFHTVRNITSPEDGAEARTIYTGTMPVKAIVDFPTDENVRGYLVEAEGKKRKAQSQVHRAIRSTLAEYPDRFCVLNGGLVIVARSSEIDDKAKTLTLSNPSIINGSQTQGVVKDFLKNYPDREVNSHIKFELIVTNDTDLVAEISIARNFQNDVRTISIVGRRGHLDELEERIQQTNSKLRLQKSESQFPSEDNDYLQTEKLLQVIAALLPDELWWKPGEASKVYTYSRKAACLKDFQEIYEKSHDDTSPEQDQFIEIYGFYLDIAAQAWDLYEGWKMHQGFAGTGLRAILRDGNTIIDVPDGIVFPILASLSEFIVKVDGSWQLDPPEQLDDSELIIAAKNAYMEIAKSKPEIMGKTKACYTALQQITSIYKKFRDLR